jgi:valyl-tRNA synthetase
MAKLEGFSKVAVIKYSYISASYYFAIYDDGNDYKVGDMVAFSGNSNPERIYKIISIEEWQHESSKKSITAEVIGKIDVSAYEKRVELRKEKEKLKKEMDKRKKEIQKELDNEYYASKDEEYAELLRKYKEL